MIFDKNQCVFDSDFQRDVWWWAIGLVPPSDSLTDAVKEKCDKNVLDGCYQWYDYFSALCADMYANPESYRPASPRQYRDILERIAADGFLQDNAMVWALSDWNSFASKINKSKAYLADGVQLDFCMAALERTGLCKLQAGDKVIFKQTQYPMVFYAMQAMERSPDSRKTPVRHHFAHCEFRQLFKSYSADYKELMRRASDESLLITAAMHDFCKSLKIQRYIHFGIIKYKYKNIRVLDYNLYGYEYPTLRVNIGTCADENSDVRKDAFYAYIAKTDENTQDILLRNLVPCDESFDGLSLNPVISLNGKTIAPCPVAKIKINPLKADLEALRHFINARKYSIDELDRMQKT